MGTTVTVVALTHDLLGRRSLVTLVWSDAPDKRVTLPVPYGCGLDRVEAEALAALKEFASEIAGAGIRTPADP
ncbi:hypothetical protein [Lichenibacterium dinghuense]|uniref:hypothetical protein n=1 Tax=Lichenibacterium dinghuense TaxID=2895977 RepID=UPI001F3A6A29|nr:hypothetical protein [Lichenibacterium sp. 6Y81]